MTVRYLGRHATFLEPDPLSALSLSRREIRCAFPPSRYCDAVLVHYCVPSPFRSPEVD